MTLDLIFVRYPHWFSATMQLRAWLRVDGREVRLVVPGRFAKELGDLGDRRGDDFLVTGDIPEFLSALEPGREVRIVLHHSTAGIEEYRRHFEAPLAAAPHLRHSIAYHADGYTNRCLDIEQVVAWQASGLQPQLDEVFFFEGLPARLNAHLPPRTSAVPSSFVEDFANRPFAADHAERACRQIALSAEGNDVLIVMLRPLGSMTFHRGAFSLDDGVTVASTMILSLIRRFERKLRRKVSIFLRVDARDMDHSRAIMQAIGAGIGDRRVEVLAEDWPEWMTFEPMLFRVAKRIAPLRLHVAALDSTGTLPFLYLDRIKSHLFGLPPAAIDGVDAEEPGLAAFRRKVAFLRSLLSGGAASSNRIVDIEPGFWQVIRK